MPRYIDADILLDKLYDHEFITLCPLDEVSDVIDYCPTVDAEPVRHAKIITVTDRHHMMHQRCSGCDEELEWKEYPNYCKNCGAKMDKGVQ